MGPTRAGRPPKAKAERRRRPAARAARRLVSYGSIRQWSGSESEREVSEARDDAYRSGVGQVLAVGWRAGVADDLGAYAMSRIDARSGCGDQRAFGRCRTQFPDGVFDQVGKSAGQEDSPERPVLISISNLRINKMAITSIITDSNSATTEMANSQNSTLIL